MPKVGDDDLMVIDSDSEETAKTVKKEASPKKKETKAGPSEDGNSNVPW